MRSRVLAVVVAVAIPLAVLGVVIARGGGSHRPARLPIVAGSSAEGAATPSAARVDAALFPYGGIVYRAGPNIPALTGSAPAYRVDNHRDASQLAAAFSLPTTPDENGAYTDGDAQLTFAPNGAWGYARQTGGGVASSGVATSCPANADCIPPDSSSPTEPQRPADLPSQDDAKRIALELLARAGLDTAHVAVTVDDGITQWIVGVDPTVDGVTTEGFSSTVTIGAGGVVDYASGNVGTPQRADTYPLLGTTAAIDRLNQGKGFVGPRPLAAVAPDTPAVTSIGGVAGGSPGSVEPAPPAATRPPETVSPATVPPPAPQEVTLTGAERVLLLATSFDGNEAWLVPAYRFTTDAGAGPTVLAIDDTFLTPPDQSYGSKGSDQSNTIEPQPAPAPAPQPGAPTPEPAIASAAGGASDGGR